MSTPQQAPPSYIPPAPPPKKSHVALIIAITVIVVVVIAGFALSYGLAYGAANDVDGGVYCSSTSVSGLTLLPPSATVAITYGVKNSGSLSVDADWAISLTIGSVFLQSEQTFHVPAGGTAFPTFTYSISSLDAIQALGSGASITVHFTRNYSVLFYSFAFQSTETTSTSSSSSASSLPSC